MHFCELGKPVPSYVGGFLEAVEREASRLDRSGGSLYDAIAASLSNRKLRSTHDSRPFICLFSATPARFRCLSALPVRRGFSRGGLPRPRERNSAVLVRSATCTLLGLYVRDRLSTPLDTYDNARHACRACAPREQRDDPQTGENRPDPEVGGVGARRDESNE